MILSLLKRIGESDRKLRRGWTGARTDLLGRNLEGRTLGIVGLGFIGKRVAAIARDVFGCRVLAFDPYVAPDEARRRKAEPVSFDDLLRQSEILTIHCPLTGETEGMIGAAELERLPAGALIISTARGGIIDEPALEAGLRSGSIAGVGLDVWEKEPPPAHHPLLAFDTVIASPHTAGVTVDSRATMARYAATQLIDLLDGRPPARPVNPEVAEAYRARFAERFGQPPGALLTVSCCFFTRLPPIEDPLAGRRSAACRFTLSSSLLARMAIRSMRPWESARSQERSGEARTPRIAWTMSRVSGPG